MKDELVEAVLCCVEAVPSGFAVSYGDIAELLETSPRIVGAIMAAHGAGAPWWRVVNASGQLPEHLHERATAHWAQEGHPRRGKGIALRHCRPDLPQWASRAEAAQSPSSQPPPQTS